VGMYRYLAIPYAINVALPISKSRQEVAIAMSVTGAVARGVCV